MRPTHKAGPVIAALILAAAAPAASAQSYDAAKDFSAASNPNSVWSYGYENTLGGTLILYTDKFAPTASIAGWYQNIALDVPFVLKNFGTAPDSRFADVVLQPGQLAFHPGPQDQFSIVRFTASTNGLYNLNAAFTPVTTDGTTTDVHVLENGTSIFSGFVTGTYNAPSSAPSFLDSLSLKSGDVVDFAVGYGANGNFSDDSTGISATLMPAAVPEASSVVSLGVLMSLGLGGLAVSARRRKALNAQ